MIDDRSFAIILKKFVPAWTRDLGPVLRVNQLDYLSQFRKYLHSPVFETAISGTMNRVFRSFAFPSVFSCLEYLGNIFNCKSNLKSNFNNQLLATMNRTSTSIIPVIGAVSCSKNLFYNLGVKVTQNSPTKLINQIAHEEVQLWNWNVEIVIETGFHFCFPCALNILA